MPLPCNIVAKGKLARLIWGMLLLVFGIILLILWALPVGSIVSWVFTGICFAGGVFALFEARAGWCAVRAMGIRTRF